MAKDFTVHFYDQNDRASFAQAVELASTQSTVELGTPGSLVHEPRRGGKPFVYWHRYDSTGKPHKQYVGPVDGTENLNIQQTLQDLLLIRDASKKLRKLGFCAADSDTAITLGAMFNGGLFAHGGLLIGTHAYGVILNTLGARVTPYSLTEDLDIAAHLEIAMPPQKAFLAILNETGLPFLEVPPLNRKHSSTSYKVRGRKLKVDLLVHAKTEPYKAVFVRALGTYATSLPHLDYLMKNAVQSIVIGKDRLVPVKVPEAGRFCIHKLAVSVLRGSSSTKSGKDIFQASVLATVLARNEEDAIEAAMEQASRLLRKSARSGAAQALKTLKNQHPEASDIFARLCK